MEGAESRWVRCQSRAFFASPAVFSFLPVARGWFPGSGSSPASDFPMPGAPFTWTELDLEPRDRIRRREQLAFISTFSATFEICRRRSDLSAREMPEMWTRAEFSMLQYDCGRQLQPNGLWPIRAAVVSETSPRGPNSRMGIAGLPPNRPSIYRGHRVRLRHSVPCPPPFHRS
jgi:hypothetical protein